MSVIGELLVQINGDNSGLRTSLRQSTREVDTFSSKMVGFAASFATAAAGAALALRGIQFNAAAEDAQVAFSVMTGSASVAKATLEDLKDYANHTPMTFADVRDATQTLLQFGMSAGEAVNVVHQLGDVSGGNAQRMQSLALAFGQMSSTGHLMGQDLLQFINAGFNPLNEIAKKTGESMTELKKRMEAGGISSQEVADAFARATSEGGQFFGMLEAKSHTLNGAFSTLTDAIDTTLGSAMEGLSGPLVDTMNVATNSLGNLSETAKGIGDAFIPVVKLVEGFVWALGQIGAIGAPSLSVIVGMLTAATVAATGFGVALGTATMGISVVIGAAVGAIGSLIAIWSEVSKKTEDARKSAENYATDYQNYLNKQYDKYAEIEHKKAADEAAKQAKLIADQDVLAEIRNRHSTDELEKLRYQWQQERQKAIDSISDARLEKQALAVIDQAYADEKNRILEAGRQSNWTRQQQQEDEFTRADQANMQALTEARLEKERNYYAEQNRLEQEWVDKEQADMQASTDLAIRLHEQSQAAYQASITPSQDAISDNEWLSELYEIRRRQAEKIADAEEKAAKKLQDEKNAVDLINGGFQIAESILNKMGQEDISNILEGINRAGTDIGKLFASGGADIGAWVDLALQGIDLISDAWAKFVGDQTKAEKEAAKAAREAVKEETKKTADSFSGLMADALEKGASKADFKQSAMAMVRKMAIETALASASMQSYFKDVGKAISDGLADGVLSSSELKKIKKKIGASTDKAYDVMSQISGLFPGFANGTNYAPGGIALVGERGPELVNLPRGSQVLPATETKQALSSGKNITINVQSNAPLDPIQTAGMVRQTMQSLAFQGVA